MHASSEKEAATNSQPRELKENWPLSLRPRCIWLTACLWTTACASKYDQFSGSTRVVRLFNIWANAKGIQAHNLSNGHEFG